MRPGAWVEIPVLLLVIEPYVAAAVTATLLQVPAHLPFDAMVLPPEMSKFLIGTVIVSPSAQALTISLPVIVRSPRNEFPKVTFVPLVVELMKLLVMRKSDPACPRCRHR